MKQHVIGIDVGGMKVRGVLLRLPRGAGAGYRVLRCLTVKTPRTRAVFETVLGELFDRLAEDRPVRGAGLGLPGMMNAGRGILLRAPNLPFLGGWDARKFAEHRFRVPIRLDNDSRCFLRAELVSGAARGRRHVAALTAGTGIGGGIAIGGAIYRGAHGSAGEFGHMVIAGSRTLERVAAKPARTPEARKLAALGAGIANLVNALDPEAVVLGGGGFFARRMKLRKLRSIARRHIVSPAAKRTPILLGALGEEAQAIGAALLFAERIAR